MPLSVCLVIEHVKRVKRQTSSLVNIIDYFEIPTSPFMKASLGTHF